MTDPLMNTQFATLDSANARSVLEDARSDPRKLRQVLTDCFFDGSIATCEAAVYFVLRNTNSSETALEIADILKSLPTAIPPRNAPSLAHLSSFLATSFPNEECSAPLNTFCYAESGVKQVAVRELISRLQETARLHPTQFTDVLSRTRGFFTEVFRGGDEFYERLVAVRGLVGIGSLHRGTIREQIVSFLLQTGSKTSASDKDLEGAPFEHEYESFLTSEIVAMATDQQSLFKIITRCLLRALDCGVASAVQELWVGQNSKLNSVVPLIRHDLFVYILTSIAAINVYQGRVSMCRDLFVIARTVLIVWKDRDVVFNSVVASAIRATSIAIASMCSSAGAEDVASLGGSVCNLLEGTCTSSSKKAMTDLLMSLQIVSQEAIKWKCGKALLSLGSLRRLITLWNRPSELLHFMDMPFCNLLECEAFQEVFSERVSLSESGISSTTSSFSRLTQLDRSQHHETRPPRSDESNSGLLSLISLLLATFAHPHSQVRHVVAKALACVNSTSAMLFFFPAVLDQLQRESNGAIVAFCFRNILLSPCLLAHQQTGKVVVRTVLQLMCPSGRTAATMTYHCGLVAIAQAAKTAPGITSSVLLAEVDKLKNSFGSLDSGTKVAACVAILNITKIRPTRGASFVPFIMQCTVREVMESTPQAVAFSFDTIFVMAEKEVLDAVKAVKIILKTFPDVLSVDVAARRSYLHLLGCVANRSNSKKGAVIAAKVIGILRNALMNLLPHANPSSSGTSDSKLSWEDVDEAALALGNYSTDEILRIAHAHEDPLEDQSEESARQENIAKECMEFVFVLLTATGRALSSPGAEARGLQALLVTIARHEWDNRQRSSFDPERIAKLRSTSEALRRARHKSQSLVSGNGSSRVPEADEDPPTMQFLRAVRTLPPGVIRALCERCAPTANAIHEDEDNEDAPKSERAASMHILQRAGALSPALPWVELATDILQSSLSSATERAAALMVLAHVEDGSFDTNQARLKWFSGQNLTKLLGKGAKSQRNQQETKQAVLGFLLHSQKGMEAFLHETLRVAAVPTTIETVLDALCDVETPVEAIFPAVKSAVQAVCKPGVTIDANVLERFAHSCLSRLDPDSMRSLLIEFVPSPNAVRLASATGDFTLLRACANLFANGEDSRSEYTETVISFSEGLRNMPFEQRRAILQDLIGKDTMTGPFGTAIVANCLRTAVFLPNGLECLETASRVCSDAERDKVSAIVQRLMAEVETRSNFDGAG